MPEFTASEDAATYTQIRGRLERAGTPIGPLDTLIAAQAAQRKLTLVTNNGRELGRVPALHIENWRDAGNYLRAPRSIPGRCATTVSKMRFEDQGALQAAMLFGLLPQHVLNWSPFSCDGSEVSPYGSTSTISLALVRSSAGLPSALG